MDTYLIPIGRGRHVLYCEPGEEPDGQASGPHPGLWRRLMARFRALLDDAEREQERREQQGGEPADDPPGGRMERLRRRLFAWMAEKIAEQRLLWRLRDKTQVRALYPEGLDREAAFATIRGSLATDYDRHRWWLIVDLLGGAIALLLSVIPGPNLLGYYFTFRIVGHYLALRGARRGLHDVRWTLEPCAALAALNGVERLAARDREAAIHRVAGELGLSRFHRFYHRAASGVA